MAERLIDRVVKSLPAPDRGNKITYDTETKGFGCRVTASGSRAFVFNYRVRATGQERRYTIGAYPEWSVARARREAEDLKRRVDRGEDPMGSLHHQRGEPTVNDLCDRYIEEHLPRKRPSSQRDDKAMIAGILRPKLGRKKVAAIRHADIDSLHRSMQNTPYRANRCLALVSKMFSLAIKWNMRPDNPAKGVERFDEHKRNRYLSIEEINRLTDVLADFPDQRAANIVRLCLLTGCRRGEALNLQWDQLDLQASVWTKPGATTKQRTTHSVPLSDAARELLLDINANLPRDENDEPISQWVFPSQNGKPLAEIKDEWHAIRDAAKLPDVRLHDLRHTYASILASAGLSLPIVGALLGHTQAQTTARYTHFYRDPLKQAADTVGEVVTGRKRARVVPLKGDGAA